MSDQDILDRIARGVINYAIAEYMYHAETLIDITYSMVEGLLAHNRPPGHVYASALIREIDRRVVDIEDDGIVQDLNELRYTIGCMIDN